MAGEGKEFRIKPDDLLSVARTVRGVIDDISGDNGNVTGNKAEFSTEGAPAHLVSALQSMFPDINQSSAYVEAYGHEHKGLNAKYEAILEQLTRLEAACRTTAESYGAQDEYTQQAVNQVGYGPGPGVPSGDTGEY